MTEQELYDYCHGEDGEGPEMHWNGDELVAFIHPSWLKYFVELIGDDMCSDGGLRTFLCRGGYVAVNLVDVCGYHGIDPTKILKKGTTANV